MEPSGSRGSSKYLSPAVGLLWCPYGINTHIQHTLLLSSWGQTVTALPICRRYAVRIQMKRLLQRETHCIICSEFKILHSTKVKGMVHGPDQDIENHCIPHKKMGWKHAGIIDDILVFQLKPQ